MINHSKTKEELLKELADLKIENEYLKALHEQDITEQKKIRDTVKPLMLSLRLLCIFAVVETLIMFVFSLIDIPHGIWEDLADSALLTIFCAPLTYWWVVKGLTRHLLHEATVAQTEAQTTKYQYHTLIDTAPDIVYTLADDGIITLLNSAFETFTGWSHDEWIGKTFAALIHPDDLKLATESFQKILKGENTPPYELRILTKSGTYLVGEFTNAPQFELGKIVGVLGIARDITERKRAEEEIQNLAKFPSENPNPVLRIARDGTLLFVNESGVSLLADWHLQVGKEAPPMLREAVFHSMHNITIQVLDLECGEKVYSFYVTPIVAADYANLYGRDITERKRAEKELLKIGTAIEQTADWVVITDRDGIIQYVNPAFTKISGYSKEEALGKTPRILKSGHHPPPLKFYETLWETILQGEVFSTTFTNKRRDGELIYEYETITPIKDKEGNITHFVSTGKEITEQRLAEEEIISQKNKFAQLFDNSPIAIASLDDKDKIAFINESFSNLFGYYIEEIKGKSLNDIIVPPELKEEAKRYSDQTHEGSQINKESYRRRKDGALVYVQIVGVPVIINKKTVGIYKMYVDLTQRKLSEEELINAKEKAEEMSRLKSNFLANMSHELRTPLIGINGFSDVLRQDIENPELKEMAEIIFNSGSRLSETLNLILDLSKLESGNMGFTYQQIDLVSETEITISSFKAAARKKGLYLKSSFNQPSIFINIDERAFHSILNNLINNAIKYTNEGGITADISLKDNFVEIKVIDSGIGIAKEYHEIIFDEFRQVSEGYSRNFEGTGLGLNITKKLVEKFGGKISVESEPGKGSTFIVKLPVTSAVEKIKEEPVIGKVPLKVLTEQKSVKPLALLVDDDTNVYPLLKRYTSGQLDMENTPDGEFAVKLCGEKRYDYIFMDINLRRGLDGVQTTRAIRKLKGYESIPIIAFTAYAMAGDKEEFLAAGCSHYLSKPFNQQEISNLLEEILNGG